MDRSKILLNPHENLTVENINTLMQLPKHGLIGKKNKSNKYKKINQLFKKFVQLHRQPTGRKNGIQYH